MRYLDAHNLERSRSLSIKAKPLTIVLPNSDGKSVLLNLMDTPGTALTPDALVGPVGRVR